MASPARQNQWIVNPAVDLSCISLGWVIFFLVPYSFTEYSGIMQFIAVSTFVAHRYITFPLVYFNPTEFKRAKTTYILTPIIAFSFVGLCYHYHVNEPEMFTIWYLFTFFHIVRQKYGILRIYSGKLGGGHKRLDEAVTYLWGLSGLLYLLCHPSERGRVMHYLRSLFGEYSPPIMVAYIFYVAAVIATLAWLFYEFRNPEGPSWPKIVFLGSVALLVGICPFYSVDAMAIASSFSHAIEYFTMVGVMVHHRTRQYPNDAPILTKVGKHVVLYILGFILSCNILFLGVKAMSLIVFQVIAYGASFMHYIYDGMIWRIRRPKVAKDVGLPPAA